MKKLSWKKGVVLFATALLLVGGFFVVAPSSHALASPLTIFSDGFESAGTLTGWITTGSQWGENLINGVLVHSGNRAAVVQGKTGTSPDDITTSVSTAGYDTVNLNYWYRVTAKLEAGNHLLAQWSPDYGTTWYTVADYTNINAGQWTNESFNLPAGANDKAGFEIRFEANFNGPLDAVRIDDVSITGEPIPACDPTNTFDTLTPGSVNAQGGWSSTGSYDQAIVDNTYGYPTFGCKTLRISDSVTSGSFGDQTFSPSIPNEAGETDALNNGMSGGVRQNHFEAQFDIASALSTLQSGMHVSVSPDRGDGARMSYLRFEDHSSDEVYTKDTTDSTHPVGSHYTDGIHVYFDDVQGTTNPANFVETDIATISRAPHTIKFVMDFVNGPSNDVVSIFIDGVLVHTGTSWENYYRFDQESNPSVLTDTPVSNSRTVDSLLFRVSGDANIADAGNGFLFDNFNLSSSTSPSTVTVTIDKYINGVQATADNTQSAAFPMHAIFPGGEGDYTLSPVGFNNPNAYEATTSDMPTGSNYSTYETAPESCTAAYPYKLVGYTTGSTLADAEAGTPTDTVPSFTNLTSDQFVVVWNDTCAPAPTNISPADGTTLTSAAWDKADWTDVTDWSMPISYVYESSNDNVTNSDGSFTSTAYVSGPLSVSEIPTTGTPEGTYFWHVKAIDTAGHSSAWSNSFQATVDNSSPAAPDTTAPSVPVLAIPTNGSSVLTNEFDFTWNPSTDDQLGAITYEYKASLDSTEVDGILTNNVWNSPTLTDPSIHSSGAADGTWYWEVRAKDAAGNFSAWSDIWSVVINTSGGGEPAPAAPVITDQTASAPTETSVTITWTTDHPATSRVVYDTVSHPDGDTSTCSSPNATSFNCYGYANSTNEDATLTTGHSVVVSGLTSGTPYFFREVSHGSPESVGPEVTDTTTTPDVGPVCTPNNAQTFVSDTDTQVNEQDAVSVTPHPVWTSIPGATWIWSEPFAIDSDGVLSAPAETEAFTKTFTITGTPADSTLNIATDNSYTVDVNGILLDTGTSGTDSDNYSSADTWVIPAADLVSGDNTITFTVTNLPKPDGYTDVNPAGLLYQITVNSQTCVTPVNTFTLTYIPGDNGSISGISPQTVNSDTSGTAVTAVPADGFHFTSWSDESTANPRTDMNVTNNISVTANFASNDVVNTNVTTQDATNVTSIDATLNGINGDTAADDSSFWVSLNPAFAITGTDPATDGAFSTPVLGPVAANTSFSSTLSAVAGLPAITPNTTYYFVAWTEVNGIWSHGDILPFTTSVSPAPEVDPFTLNYTADTNGSLTGMTSQTVNSGSDGTAVTAVPDSGFQFVNWSDSSTANPRTDMNVHANLTVTANFAVASVQGGGGGQLPPPAPTPDIVTGGGGGQLPPPVGQVLGAETGPTQSEIVGCGMNTTGFSITTGESCITNIPHTDGQVLGAEKFIFTLFLKMGPPYHFAAWSNEVMELQKFLIAAGYNSAPVDGKFGPITKAALIQFQLANGLKGDGVVGAATRAVLNK